MKVFMKNNLMIGEVDDILKDGNGEDVEYIIDRQLAIPLKDLFTEGKETSRQDFFGNLRGKMLFIYARGIEHLSSDMLNNESEV